MFSYYLTQHQDLQGQVESSNTIDVNAITLLNSKQLDVIAKKIVDTVVFAGTGACGVLKTYVQIAQKVGIALTCILF